MDISVGIMAHNEEKYIGGLLDSLLNQKISRVKIKEVMVVSSGSTDGTNNIVIDFSEKNKMIRLVTESERRGNTAAINKFLGLAKTGVVVLMCGDILLENNAIETLCMPLCNKEIGISIAKPVSVYSRNSFLGYVVYLVWELYHLISLKTPKYGELMGFKHSFQELEDTSVDEEFVGMLVTKTGLKSLYVPEAVYYAGGPRSLRGVMKQRRRIFAGHLLLSARKGYRASAMNILDVLRNLKLVGDKKIHWILLAIGIECLGRALGSYDYLRKRESIIWDIVK